MKKVFSNLPLTSCAMLLPSCWVTIDTPIEIGVSRLSIPGVNRRPAYICPVLRRVVSLSATMPIGGKHPVASIAIDKKFLIRASSTFANDFLMADGNFLEWFSEIWHTGAK